MMWEKTWRIFVLKIDSYAPTTIMPALLLMFYVAYPSFYYNTSTVCISLDSLHTLVTRGLVEAWAPVVPNCGCADWLPYTRRFPG